MMDGVVILNQTQVASEVVFNEVAFVFGFLFGACIGAALGFLVSCGDTDFIVLPIAGAIISGFLIGVFAGGAIAPKVVSEETHYEVFIEENVDLATFLSKYEIIEQRGQIYTVKEKEVK